MRTDLSLALSNSISEEAQSVSSDLLEVGLDLLINDSVVKEIPFLSTAISIYKIGSSIRELRYIQKLATFVSEMNQGIVNEEHREYYKNRIIKNELHPNKEIEYILLLIDRYIQNEKVSMLAKLYLAYLDEVINWNEFSKYAEVVERFLPGDYNMLSSAPAYKTEYDRETDSIQRLIALGLVIEGFRTMETQEADGTLYIDPPELREKRERNYARTEFGNKLVSILDMK